MYVKIATPKQSSPIRRNQMFSYRSAPITNPIREIDILLTTFTNDMLFDRSIVWQVQEVQGQRTIKTAMIKNLMIITQMRNIDTFCLGSEQSCRSRLVNPQTVVKMMSDFFLPKQSISEMQITVERVQTVDPKKRIRYLKLRSMPLRMRGRTKFKLQQTMQATIQLQVSTTVLPKYFQLNSQVQLSYRYCLIFYCSPQSSSPYYYYLLRALPSIMLLIIYRALWFQPRISRYLGDQIQLLKSIQQTTMPGILDRSSSSRQLQLPLLLSSRKSQATATARQQPAEKQILDQPKVQVRRELGLISVRKVPLRGSTIPMPIPQRNLTVKKQIWFELRALRTPSTAWREAAIAIIFILPIWSALYCTREPSDTPKQTNVMISSLKFQSCHQRIREGTIMLMMRLSVPSLRRSKQVISASLRWRSPKPMRLSRMKSNEIELLNLYFI